MGHKEGKKRWEGRSVHGKGSDGEREWIRGRKEGKEGRQNEDGSYIIFYSK